MKTSQVLTITIIVTMLVSLISIWFYPSIQDFMASNAMWNGIQVFSDTFSVEDIDTLEDLPETPETTVLVVIPYLEYSDEDLAGIDTFVKNGGVLLLMDDYGYGNTILEYLELNLRFSNAALLDPLFCYRNQRIPKITDFSSDISGLGIELVLLNHATVLTGDEGTALAYSSPTSFVDTNENGREDSAEQSGPFSVAASTVYAKGMVVVVSDPSVLISSMLDRDDNHAFLDYLMNVKGVPEKVLMDRSHLSKTPLDQSKIRLSGAREIMANPYALTGVIALIFVVISRYTIRKGEAIG